MKNGIKIIKPAERAAQRDYKDATAKEESVSPHPIESSRDTASIIASWIGEFREKKRTELAGAYAFKNSVPKAA